MDLDSSGDPLRVAVPGGFASSVLDALAVPILLVDEVGHLIAANQNGHAFARENNLPDPTAPSAHNYLAACENGRGAERRQAHFLAKAWKSFMADPNSTRSWDWPGKVAGRFYLLQIAVVEKPFKGRSILWLEQAKSTVETAQVFSLRDHVESLKRLAGGVAHDFNNLLTGMLGYADLALFSVSADSPAHRHIEQIRKGALQATDLAQRLLAYSGKGPLMLQSVSLAEVVAQTLSLQAEDLPAHCRLEARLDAETKPIQGDVEQLRLIVVELFRNAQEALRGGSGMIRVEIGQRFCQREDFADCFLGEDMLPGPYAVLEVADSGCGFDPNLRETIFEPFFTTTKGRGLGLTTVLGLVLRHGGTLAVETQPEAGTCFRLFFPTGQYVPG